MMDVEVTPLYTIGLPLAAFVGSWLVSKVLRISLVLTLLGACLPLALPFMELPFTPDFANDKPEYLIAGGWLFLGALLCGWVVVRPLFSSTLQGIGVVKCVYLAVLAGALMVVGILLINPPVLDQYVPGWHGTAGIVLLTASLLSMALALARAVRAAVIFAVWAFVSVVLASEVFLQKLPNDVVREDLRSLEPLIPLREIDTVLRSLSFSAAAPDSLRAFVLSGSAAAGYPLFGGERVAGQMEKLFERAGVAATVTDVSLRGVSVFEQKELIPKILPAQPDFVVIAGWKSDSERGRNSFGIPGMTEAEARTRVSRLSQLKQYPMVERVLSSSLYRYVVNGEDGGRAGETREELPQRVSGEMYGRMLNEVVAAYRKAGVQVVLATEPFIPPDEVVYRDAMQHSAKQNGAVFVETTEVVANSPLMVSRGQLLSRDGCRGIAQAIIDALVRGDGAGDSGTQGALSRTPSEAQGEQPPHTTVQPRHGNLTLVLAQRAAELSDRGRQRGYLGSVGDTERGDPLRLVVRPAEVDGDLIFRVKIKESGTRFYRVVLAVNGEFVADRRLDAREATHVRFQLPDVYRSLPYVELELRTVASPPPESDRIKGTDVYAVVPVGIRTAPGTQAVMNVDDEVMYATEHYFACSVDYRSGQRVSSVRSDDARVFAKWVMQQPWGDLIVGGVASVGGDQGEAAALSQEGVAALQAALGFAGVSERSIVDGGGGGFIGVAGSKGAQALTVGTRESEGGVVDLRLGGKLAKSYTRFTVEDVSVNGKPLKVYGRV